jgi:hypothetical protein
MLQHQAVHHGALRYDKHQMQYRKGDKAHSAERHRHSTAQHSTAEHTKKRGTPHCTKRRSTQYSTAQHTVHYGTALTWIPCTASLLCTRMIFGGTSRTPNSNAQERRERVRERRSTLAVTLLCQGFEYWNMCVHLSWSKLVIEHVCMCVCMHMCSCVWRF